MLLAGDAVVGRGNTHAHAGRLSESGYALIGDRLPRAPAWAANCRQCACLAETPEGYPSRFVQ
jgi:hypothetical protein